MQKWGKVAKQKSESSNKLSFRERIAKWKEKKNIYSAKLLKRDEKEKAQEVKMIKRATLKKPVVKRIWNILAIFSLCIVALGVYNAFRHNGKLENLQNQITATKKVNAEGVQENLAMRSGVEYFVQNFIKEYVTVKPGDEAQKGRQKILSKYLAQGLDKDAGVDYQSLNGEQIYKGSRILEVESAGKNQANVYVDVTTEFAPKDSPDKKQSRVYYLIRVYGSSDGYTIVDLPQPYMPKNGANKSIQDRYASLSKDMKSEQEVRKFLESFFKTYTAKDRGDEIKFFFRNAADIQSLQGLMEYVKVEDVKVYPMQKEKQFLVQCSVKLKQPVSGVISEHSFEFTIDRKGEGKFEILKMQPVSYEVK
ncbi:conjugal transfer protein [Bacillus sp. FSL K6-2944]|uniref:conjugal transfer protein n=1 Tax=Bacillus sp. FSL K6-2944 TaxID=2921486 RepID=UPI0030F75E9F